MSKRIVIALTKAQAGRVRQALRISADEILTHPHKIDAAILRQMDDGEHTSEEREAIYRFAMKLSKEGTQP